MPPSSDRKQLPVLGLVCAGLIPWTMFLALGDFALDGWVLDLGDGQLPRPRYRLFLLAVFMLGIPMAGLLAAGGVGFVGKGERWERLAEWVDGLPRAVWWAGGGLLAVVLPLLVRWFILEGAPLTDDEGSYWFGAQMLLDGHLKVPSHPEPVFYTRFTMVNDGWFYPQYFLGWPALMALGAAVGAPGMVNPILCGLGAVCLYFLVDEWFGRREARWATLLYVASPFVMIGAATLLSHTSCLTAILACHLAAVHARKPGAPGWQHAAVALAFSVAFFIRPTTAIGLAGPALFVWAKALFEEDVDVVGRLVSFFVPAAAMAGLFFWVNWAQNGSPWMVAYQAHKQSAVVGGVYTTGGVANFGFSGVSTGPAIVAATLIRFNFAIWGWPFAFLFAALAIGARRARLFWAAAGLFVVVHFFLNDGGIDSFGPVHYFEWTFPVIVLSAVGLVRLTDWLAWLDDREVLAGWQLRLASVPAMLVAALIYTSAVTYIPVRLVNLGWIADLTSMPERAAERTNPDDRIVAFYTHSYETCLAGPDRIKFWPPHNSPERDGRVVWLNHVTLERDRRHAAEYYPDRQPYLLARDPYRCTAELVPLSEVTSAPDGEAWQILQKVRQDPDLREHLPPNYRR